MPLTARGTVVSWANRPVGIPSYPAPPRPAAPPYAAPLRPARGMSGFWIRHVFGLGGGLRLYRKQKCRLSHGQNVLCLVVQTLPTTPHRPAMGRFLVRPVFGFDRMRFPDKEIQNSMFDNFHLVDKLRFPDMPCINKFHRTKYYSEKGNPDQRIKMVFGGCG